MKIINHRSVKNLIIKTLWLLPGLVFYALFRLAFAFSSQIEQVYSRGIFRVLSQMMSTATGVLPFSLGELVLYGFIIFVIVYIIKAIVETILAKKQWWIMLLNKVVLLLGIFSMVYAVFVGVWGFNYARQPLRVTLDLDASPSTVDELYMTCEALIERAYNLRSETKENENGVFAPQFSKSDYMLRVPEYYKSAAEKTGYHFLGGLYGPIKPVLCSAGLSYAHITGVYFPFTAEANVNADTPMLLFPATSLHEAAHQRGFAREDEANFLAYYVSSYADDVSTQYSGTMLALSHAMNKLYGANSDMYYELRELYSAGMNADLQDKAEYWQQFESPVSEASRAVNNTFLKANMQQDGVKSYGRMVDLLIGLWRQGGI